MTFASNLEAMLTDKYEDKNVIRLYTSITDDNEKENDMNNILAIWGGSNCIIITPTIEVVGRFDKLHFDKCYGVICENSCSQRFYYQMVSRVRCISEPANFDI